MEEQFCGQSVPWLKEYLTKRGIQESDKGCSERKAKEVELVVKAIEMNVSDVIASKLRTVKGVIPLSSPEEYPELEHPFFQNAPIYFR